MDALGIVDTAYGEAIREFEYYSDKVTNIESMKQAVDEVIGDDSGEFGKALVNHFPVADGMPDSSDVRAFMNSWVDRECYDDAVTLMCTIMEFIYAIDFTPTQRKQGGHRQWQL